jgi:hypothetical protein
MSQSLEKISISLERAEGKEHECVTKVFSSIDKAQKCLYRWSATAPQTEAYHKIYVRIWDSQIEIKFQFDLQFSYCDLTPYLCQIKDSHTQQCKKYEKCENISYEALSYLAHKTALLAQL